MPVAIASSHAANNDAAFFLPNETLKLELVLLDTAPFSKMSAGITIKFADSSSRLQYSCEQTARESPGAGKRAGYAIGPARGGSQRN